MNQIKKLLDIARGELGYREGNNNDTKYGAWYGLNYNPWCMMFVVWCMHEAGVTLPHVSASCSDMRWWYATKRPSMYHVTDPQPGDIVIYDGHTGIVEEVYAWGVVAIEGNYSNKVSRVHRNINDCLGFIRPDWPEDKEAKPMYHSIEDVPSWGVEAVTWAINAEILKGTSNADLGLTNDHLKTLVYLYRYHVKFHN